MVESFRTFVSDLGRSAMKFRQQGLFPIAFTVALAAAQNQPASLLPAPTGPYDVGRASLQWTDRSRRDNESPDGHRQLVVWLWYLAAKTPEQPAAWQPAAEWASGRTSVRYHIAVGYFVCRAAIPHRSLPSL